MVVDNATNICYTTCVFREEGPCGKRKHDKPGRARGYAMQVEKNERLPANYAEAMALGYVWGRTAWTRGYVSRRYVAPEKRPVYRGRKGIYVLCPSLQSTQYCHRVYLVREDA